IARNETVTCLHARRARRARRRPPEPPFLTRTARSLSRRSDRRRVYGQLVLREPLDHLHGVDRARLRLRRGRTGARQHMIKARWWRSEEHTSELQSQSNLVCRLLLEKTSK